MFIDLIKQIIDTLNNTVLYYKLVHYTRNRFLKNIVAY